jgi:hypothetical protein
LVPGKTSFESLPFGNAKRYLPFYLQASSQSSGGQNSQFKILCKQFQHGKNFDVSADSRQY